MYFAEQIHLHFVTVAFAGIFLHLAQNAFGVCLQFVNGVGIRGVIGQSNHTFLLTEVDANHTIVVGRGTRFQFAEILGPTVYFVMVFHLLVGNPNTAQASGFGSHDVDTVAKVNRQVLHARSGKFKHFVLDKAIVEHRLYHRNGHIVRTNTALGCPFEPYQHYFGRIDVPSVVQQLLHKFATTFANAHIA